MNVNLGEPYEALLKKIVKKGYAGNQTEAIRQSIIAFNRQLEEQEAELVHKAVEMEMQDIDQVKLYTHKEIKKKLGF